jgi:hypothetical protein
MAQLCEPSKGFEPFEDYPLSVSTQAVWTGTKQTERGGLNKYPVADELHQLMAFRLNNYFIHYRT